VSDDLAMNEALRYAVLFSDVILTVPTLERTGLRETATRLASFPSEPIHAFIENVSEFKRKLSNVDLSSFKDNFNS